MRDIAQLKNTYTDEPISQEIERVLKIKHLVDTPSFILGFGACKKDTFDEVVEYMAKRLCLQDQHPLENFDMVQLISNGTYDLRDQFKERIPFWNKQPGETILVTSTGFEQMPHYKQRSSSLQVQGAAHILTQNIKEDTAALFENRQPYYSSLNKVVILVTHIGYSAGEEAYNFAVQDANRTFRGNRFQDFNFEIKD